MASVDYYGFGFLQECSVWHRYLEKSHLLTWGLLAGRLRGPCRHAGGVPRKARAFDWTWGSRRVKWIWPLFPGNPASCSSVYSGGKGSFKPSALGLILPPSPAALQEDWSGLPLPPPGDLPHPGTEPRSPALQENSLPAEPPGKPFFRPPPPRKDR